MPFTTEVYDVTQLVGNQGVADEATRVAKLIEVVYRTVQADTWFALGGVGTIRAYFNPTKKKWYLSVYTDIPQAEVSAVLTKLSA